MLSRLILVQALERLWRTALLAGLALGFTGPVIAAELKGMSPPDIRVTRGDRVTLQVNVSGENLSTTWWTQGRIICQSDSCSVDTTSFSPGQTVIDVVVEDAQGLILMQFKVSASDAPPLYTPKNLVPDIGPPAGKFSTIPKGQWMIVEREGGVSHVHPARPKVITQAPLFMGGQPDEIYQVSTGGLAIVRRVGEPEQVLLSSSAKFTLRDGRFELLAGRALWRTQPASATASSKLTIVGGQLESVGPSLIGVEVGFLTKNESRAVIQNFQSVTLTSSCNLSEPPVTIGRGRAGMMVLNSESICVRMDPEDFKADDSSAWVSLWSPWWVREQMFGPLDRWRSDFPLFSDMRPLEERLKDAENFKTQANCANALDQVNIRQAPDKKSTDRMKLVGFCQFQLGMYGKSLTTFAVLNDMKVDSALTAAMMAKIYQNLNRHDLALNWFNEARARGYSPIAELGRLAIVSAEAQKDSAEKLKWLEVTWIAESESKKIASDRNAYDHWFEYRPRGGQVNGAIYVDSQAVPLNTKASIQPPLVLKASRLVMAALEGLWWTEKEISKQANLRLHGQHSFSSPIDSKMSFVSSSINTLGVDFKLGNFDWRDKSGSDRWNFLAGTRLGMGISGGESQRDQYGFVIMATRPSWTGFSVAIESDKYFDPQPKGADVIDLDMERYTGSVDHSHIDLKLLVGFESRQDNLGWSFRIGSGSVDYRTVDMASYDHSLTEVGGDVKWSVLPRISISAGLSSLNRSFNHGGSDSKQKLSASGLFRLYPLWRLLINLGLEQRTVSGDVLTSWHRHLYGVAIQTDL